MHGGQLGRRVGAQLVGERLAGPLVDGERFRGAAGLAQGLHQRADQPLAQRMLGHECGQLGNQLGTAAELQVGLYPAFGRGQPEFVQSGECRLEELHPRDVQHCRSTPQAERLAQRARGSGGVVGKRGPSVRDQSLEEGYVNGARVDQQSVAGRMRLDHHLRQRPTQPGHQRLQGITSACRRLVAPDCVHELSRGNQLAGGEGQLDQQRAEPSTGHRNEGTVAAADLEWPQHPDPHLIHSAESAGQASRHTATSSEDPHDRPACQVCVQVQTRITDERPGHRPIGPESITTRWGSCRARLGSPSGSGEVPVEPER